MGKTRMTMWNTMIPILFLLFSSPAFAGFENVGHTYDGGGARDLWYDGTYVYLANNGDLRAYTFNGSTFTNVGHVDDGGYAVDVWDDGTYIYLANDEDGLRAYTFNGSTFTNVGHINNGGYAHGVWGDGTYIYIANHYDGLRAYTFNGSTFTNVGHVDPPSGEGEGVWSDGTYIYLANGGGGLRAYTFNGSTFTSKGYINDGGTGYDVWGDGEYIYLANGSDGLRAYTFNGSTFTNVGHVSSGDSSLGVWGDGEYIYLADHADGLKAYTFNGSNFHEAGHIDNGGHGYGVIGDSTYIYLANWGDGIRAYAFTADLSISNVSGSCLDGETVTISGSGFGAKATATPAVFENFDSNDAGRQDGDQIKNKNCSHYGQWENYSNDFIPIYKAANNRRGSTLSSYHKLDAGTADHAPMTIQYSASHNPTLLLSFWVRFTFSNILDGGDVAGNLKIWRVHKNDDPAWDNNIAYGEHLHAVLETTKHNWAVDENLAGCWKARVSLGQNDNAHFTNWPATGDETLNYTLDYDGAWNHIIIFLKAGDNDTANGSAIVWVDGNKLEDTNVIKNWLTGDIWAAATFGWYPANYEGGVFYLQFDDIYIDTYWQSVWIGNASSWDKCTHREIQIPKTWSDTAITVEVNQGSFATCKTRYLFVVDADGNVNSQGYPIRFPTGAGEAPCPPHQENPKVRQ